MKVRLETDWARQAVKVWFYEPSEGGSRVHRLTGPDLWETVEVKNGQLLPEPSLIIPEDWLQSLAAEASGLLPIDRAGERHLEDAIRVRDRILDAFLPKGES